MKPSGTKHTNQGGTPPPIKKHPQGSGNKYPANGVHRATTRGSGVTTTGG